MFYHSIISDWNNGNAHFLRGVVKELLQRSHYVTVFEPRDAWSMQNLESTAGPDAEARFRADFPEIRYVRYQPDLLQLDEVLETADVVIVHEWNPHDLVKSIGSHHRENPNYTLLFHDTHHRSVTSPHDMSAYDLSEYDGVLAFGNVVRDIYLQRSWAQRAWTWHEAADATLFSPHNPNPDIKIRDLLWIGNWGDEERTAELHQYLFDPARELKLSGTAHGVRYPDSALDVLRNSGIQYRGWLPNSRVPAVAAQHRIMVHVPRRPYVQALPGIPTIRPFEAMACGIPLVSSYWNDTENMFEEGRDYLLARSPAEMRRNISMLLNEPDAAREIASHARHTIASRHTCAHRVDQLLQIIGELSPTTTARTI
jgi:spore maturation protein CgeB